MHRSYLKRYRNRNPRVSDDNATLSLRERACMFLLLTYTITKGQRCRPFIPQPSYPFPIPITAIPHLADPAAATPFQLLQLQPDLRTNFMTDFTNNFDGGRPYLPRSRIYILL